MTNPARQTLSQRFAEQTPGLVVAAAVELLEQDPALEPVTMRAAANHAGISERTVFRHFPTRESFLQAVAAEVVRRIEAPPLATTIADLPDYVARLYRRFEATSALTRAAVQGEVARFVHHQQMQSRIDAVAALLDDAAPGLDAAARARALANIGNVLRATSWQYYRHALSLPAEEAVACAQLAVRQSLAGLGLQPDPPGSRGRRGARRGAAVSE